MSQNQNDNELLVRFMTMNDFRPMMRDKVMASVVQMRRGRAHVTARYRIHACYWTVLATQLPSRFSTTKGTTA